MPSCANARCAKDFDVTGDDLAFLERISPTIAGQKFPIPAPTRCPDCRQQRRLSTANEWNLYPDACDLCKKRILTQCSPSKRPTIYCRSCWNGAAWDPLEYGVDVDFSRPFTEQVIALRDRSPNIALYTGNSLQNSDYVHCVDYMKNCYLVMHADKCEDCYYGYGFKGNRSCVDGYYNFNCELCYDCVDCHACYGLIGSQDCMNCSSGAFLRDCIGCKNCFLCVGLREKSYCFENEQLSKEEYEKKVAAINTGSHAAYQDCLRRRRELELKHPFKESQGHQNENCVGNNVYRCKNAYQCYDCEDVEDARYCTQVVTGAKNVADIYQWGMNLQNAYDSSHVGDQNHGIYFCVQAFLSTDVLYSWFAQSCKNCFGCANIRSKKYCILNKQYSKEDYEALVPKIIEHMKGTGEWGEFFPIGSSLFGYNKSVAMPYFPLIREQAEERGFAWDDAEAPTGSMPRQISAEDVPDDIRDAFDDILECGIVCEATGKPFRIVKQEIDFHRSMNVPLPRRSWLQRHFDRFALRNPRILYARRCAKCSKDIRTTFTPDRPEIVYCEECYLKEVY